MTLFRPRAQRRVVLALDDATYASLSGTALAALEASHDLQVVSLHDVHTASDDPVASALVETGLLVPGAVLVQNPLSPDSYVDAADAEQVLALDKADALALLCQYLGAKSVELKQVVRVSGARSRKGEASGSAGPVKAKAQVVRDDDQLSQALLSVVSKFSGSGPDLEAAHRLVRERRLSSDSSIITLVAMVEHPGNRLNQRTVKISMSRELARSLDALAEMSGAKLLPVGVSARYADVIKERREIEAEYTIRF